MRYNQFLRNFVQRISTHCRCQCNEKLATVRIWPCVRHAQSIWSVVLQVWLEFVLELASPYALTTGTSPGGIARLYHETLDNSMKYMSVEISILRMHAEVFYCPGDILAKEIHVDVAKRRVDYRRVVYLLHVCGLRRRYDVLFRRLLVEYVTIAFLILRILRLSSCEHVKPIFFVSRAKQRRIRPIHFHRGILGSLHLDGQRSSSLPRFSLY